MKITENKSGNFTPHPETDGQVRAIIVDVTPLKTMSSKYGEREVFRIVYESETKDESGMNFCVWSPPYTPSLNEKSFFRRDCEKILGRKLTALELSEGFEPDSLIGWGVVLIVTHESVGDKKYAQIQFIAPDKKPAILASGKYVRIKDRPEKDAASSSDYRAVPKADGDERADWQKTKVHIGKHAGVQVGDLSEEAVRALINMWLPTHRANAKPKADDKRLASALKEVGEMLGILQPAESDSADY